jgi:hypothetical protein
MPPHGYLIGSARKHCENDGANIAKHSASGSRLCMQGRKYYAAASVLDERDRKHNNRQCLPFLLTRRLLSNRVELGMVGWGTSCR